MSAGMPELPPGVVPEGAPDPFDQTAKQAMSPLLAVSITFMVVNTLLVILRFVTVLYLRATRLKLGWDDWLLIPAWVFTIALAVCGLIVYHYETVGNHGGHELIMDTRLYPLLKTVYAGVLLIVPAYTFTRLSILALFLRIFNGRKTRAVAWFMIAFVLCQWLGFFFASIFQCWPVQYFWDRGPGKTGTCVDINAFYRSFMPPNIASDIVLIVLPLPTVWKLKASQARKWGLTVLFFSGVIALFASIVRLVEVQTHSSEVLYPAGTQPIITWLVLEPSLYLITACLPSMFPLVRFLIGRPLRGKALRGRAVPHVSHGSRSGRFPGGNVSMGDFTRLVDPNDTRGGTSAYADLNSPTSAGSKGAWKGQMKYNDIEQHGHSVPLDDLRKVTEGAGVLVTTEISVTQEEKIKELIGF